MSFLISYCYYFRHGLGRTDFYILNDPELSFREIVQKNLLSAVSGSFTTEMLEAAKLETAKTEAVKLDATKGEAVKLDTAKTETPKTDVTKLDVVKTEAIEVESTESETINSEIPKSETAKTEKVDLEIKIESVELQEIEVEKVEKVEINDDSTSEKIESTRTEAIAADINGDLVNTTDEKVEIPSNEEPKEEQIDVNNGESIKPDITDDSKVEEEVSNIPTEQLNDKSSDEVADHQNEGEKSENNTSVENKQTDENEKDESKNSDVENTVKSDDVESKIESIRNVINEAPSDTIGKFDTKVTEPVIKPKECSSSVESVDRLKAMFPELEVVHKDISNPTIDKLPMHKPLQQIDQTIAHLLATSYQNPIKWPKVSILMILNIYLI